MKAFITGMGGFVGAHLAARLVSDGWDVSGTIRPGAPPIRLRALGIGGLTEEIAVDLTDPVALRERVRATDADVAFLLAAARAEGTPAERDATVAVNTTGARWIAEALPDRCRAIVRLGSSTEYGASAGPMDEATALRPRGFFGATKAAGSLLLAAACPARGQRAAILRAFQIYGPFDHPGRLVPAALRAARESDTLSLTGPGLRRDWVYVDDVVDACVRAALADDLPSGQVLNIGTGHQVANEELVARVAEVTGRPVTVAIGSHPGRHWDAESWVCDPSRAGELLGWKATTDLDEGLRRCWRAEEGPHAREEDGAPSGRPARRAGP